MTRTLASLTAALLLIGCAPGKLGRPPGGEHQPIWTESDAEAAPEAHETNPVKPFILPSTKPQGTVVAVNEVLRFVVIDFDLLELPKSGQEMFLYRDEQKVGSIKITGPAQGQSVAADLIDGEARIGDLVRAD